MIYQAYFKPLQAIIFTAMLALCVPFMAVGQPETKADDITVQVADFRGKGYYDATIASLKASKNNIVIVLVCGADQNVINKTEAGIKGLIRDGYTRVAMLLSDPMPDETTPIVAIIVNGDNPSYMRGVYVHGRYEAGLYELVVDAYKEYILGLSNE